MEIPKHGIPTKHDAKVYTQRLVNSAETLRHIDTGDFPCTEWSSGEHKPIFNKKGEQIGEELVTLPMAVLRKAVAHAIDADLQMLSEWGCRDTALKVIRERKPR